MGERFYELSATERDRLILKLRDQGLSLRAIGRRVGMTGSGVLRSLERIERGGAGIDRRP